MPSMLEGICLLIFWRRGSGSNRRIKVLQFFAHLLSGYENKALPSERVRQEYRFLYCFSPYWQRNGSVRLVLLFG